MALTYDEGMGALRAMFPTWDVQALAELLEANEGHLENTIDMMLTMEPPISSASPSAAAQASPAARPAVAGSYALDSNDGDDDDEHYATASASPAPSYRKSPTSSPRHKTASNDRSVKRVPRVTLPDDFLRLPVDSSYDHHELSEQEQRDAALAEMLQNEIFRQELFANEEFSEHFHGGRESQFEHDRPSRSSRSSTTAYPDKSASEIATETFNAMSVKFASMSEVMKKKASEMYMRFQTRADAPTQKDPYSHRPLMADDSSDEEDSARDVRQRHSTENSHSASSRDPATGPMRRVNAHANKKNE